MHFSLKGAWILLLWATLPAIADDQAPLAAPEAAPKAEAEAKASKADVKAARVDPAAKKAGAPDPAGKGKDDTVTAAEQVVNLRRSIDDGEARLAEMKDERSESDAEYTQAEAAFAMADSSLEEAKKAIKDLPEDDREGRKAAQAEVARLEKAWKLAKDRFDLAIEDRKVIVEQTGNLEKKLQLDRKALDKLEGKEPPAADPAAAGTPAPAVATPVPGGPPAPAAPVMPAAATTPAPAVTGSPAATQPAPAAAGTPAIPGVPTVPGTPAPTAPAAAANQPPSEEMVKAVEDAQTKAAAAKVADTEAESVTARLANLDEEIALEQKLLATARKQRENAGEIHRGLNESFRERSLAGAPRAELDGLLAQVKQIEKRHKEAGDDVHEHSTRLEALHTERADLQAEQIDAMHKAQEARAQVKIAEDDIKRLENPFSPRNVLHWLVDHGPKMVMIILAILIGHWLSRLFSQRVIRLLAHSGARGSGLEREDRARTLVGVFHNAASLAIMVGGGLMILQEAGVPIAPLLGGAAVFGLAIAFGAQNLIRDYFYGFVILLENQYKLNDVVQIGDRSGQVEKITLRMTVLRDLEGRVHFLPNGEITAVTNMTHGWSRALFDIGVAYKEDVDHVMAILMTLAADLRKDPVLGPMILEDATMLGVDSLAESAVVIKFFIKTRPLQQWNVKRELLRRIKNRFDELNIEIPFPHRTVYVRNDTGVELPAPSSSRILQGLHSPRSSV